MTEKQVRKVIVEITTDPNAEREYELRHPDCLIDIPQSGERFDRDGMREVQRNFPGGPPEMRLERLAGEGDVWVAELVSDYEDERGGLFNVCVILEFTDGRIVRETRYYAEPFEPPAGRAEWRLSAGTDL
ncbi:MAG TPA: nuclear transport factor 2 family protein [Solirubrobacterales bacterium]|nr:nuclear transport factor 2 family protein [Solirubrobacterales bacterium]